MADREVQVLYAGQEMARHAKSPLRRSSVIERSHLTGIVGSQFVGSTRLAPPPAAAPAEFAARPRRVRGAGRGRLVMARIKKTEQAIPVDELDGTLTRLKLTVIREHLDTPLDQAARADMTLREALADDERLTAGVICSAQGAMLRQSIGGGARSYWGGRGSPSVPVRHAPSCFGALEHAWFACTAERQRSATGRVVHSSTTCGLSQSLDARVIRSNGSSLLGSAGHQRFGCRYKLGR